MSAKCNRCDAEIIWPPYESGVKKRPLNPDNTVHECMKQNPTPKTSTGITDNALTSVSILAECLAFKNMFFDVESDTKFDALARIYISRMMKR